MNTSMIKFQARGKGVKVVIDSNKALIKLPFFYLQLMEYAVYFVNECQSFAFKTQFLKHDYPQLLIPVSKFGIFVSFSQFYSDVLLCLCAFKDTYVKDLHMFHNVCN